MEEREVTIGLGEIFLVLRKRLVMIISITFAAALVSGIISFYFITPIYQSSTQILLNQKRAEQGVQAVQMDLQLIETYSDIIKSPAILGKVKEQLGLDTSAEALGEQITIISREKSQVMSITVKDASPEKARDIANTVVTVFKEEIPKITSLDNVTILAQAEVVKGQSPVSPSPMKNIAIAFVGGLITSLVLAFLLEHLKNDLNLGNATKREKDINRAM
ncbi:YveK family protein [Bacillus sp. OTU530]|uniref:YveK family protein n=1 Tax=Bacillus sp. OTU530 TaxID=3043862 RepID=UPI00313B9505